MKHPGTILAAELESRGLSATRLASAINVPTNRITGILNGERSISPDTAIRLAAYFGDTAERWNGLQSAYDLATCERERGAAIRAEIEALFASLDRK